MSLLDDVSIVVTPNAYKAGTLYGVLPTATEGSEIVTNSDMESGFTGGVANNYTVSAGTPSQETSIYVSANNSQKISTSSSTAIFSHNNITVVSGTRFKASCFVRSDVSQSVKFLDFNGSGEQITQTIPANTWVNLIFYITKGNTTFIPRVQTLTNQTGYLLIDNVSVIEVTNSDMDVTRATAATRVDEDGLVNYAQVISDTELITNGDFATDSDWSKGGNWSIGGGVATANGNSNGNIAQNIPLTVGTDYSVTYTVINASAGSQIGISTNATSIQIVRTTDGTYTETFTATLASFYIRSLWNNGNPVSVDNVSVKKVDLDNVPRIDYTGGGCPHILAEPQRTNLVTYSEDFSQWTVVKSGTGVNPIVTVNYATSPSGEQNASRVQLDIGSGTSSNDFSQFSEAITISNLTAYSRSIYVKSNTGSNQDIVIQANGEAITTSTITTEWQRFEASATSDSTSGFFRIRIRGNEGTVSQADILVWGAQLEEGSYPTSYIPTSGSTVTRNQDQFTRDGIGSLINSTEGCVFGEGNFAESNSGGSYVYFASLSDGTVNNRLEIRQTSGNVQFLWRVATYQSQIQTSGVDVGNNFKFAVSYSSANIKFYVNGNLIGTINTPTLWSANTLNRLAFDDGAGGNRLSGKVKQLQVYKTALTDAQLTSLTS